jgi:hypothetical protein
MALVFPEDSEGERIPSNNAQTDIEPFQEAVDVVKEGHSGGTTYWLHDLRAPGSSVVVLEKQTFLSLH